MNATYIIVFEVKGKSFRTKIPNCSSEMHAMIKLKDFVTKKFGCDYKVISCKCSDNVDLLKDFFGFR